MKKANTKANTGGRFVQIVITIRYSIGLVLLLAGIIFGRTGTEADSISYAFITAGILMLIISNLKSWQKTEQFKDIRSLTVSDKAYKVSFLLLFIFAFVVLIIHWFRPIDSILLIADAVFITVLIYLLAFYYLARKHKRKQI